MKLTINIELGNSAFEDNRFELDEMLAKISGQAKAFCGDNSGWGVHNMGIIDSNGNGVGTWEIK
jgi:hypothetical protein